MPIGKALQRTHFFHFLSPKLSYVLFILARDHLGKLVFAGDGKISLELGSSAETRLPTTFVFSCAVTKKCIIKTRPLAEIRAT